MPSSRVRAARAFLGIVTLAFGLATIPTSPAAAAGPCGVLPYDPVAPPTYTHVIVIMDENTSYKTWLNNPGMPYTNSLALACGSETNMHPATHPSKNNYAAATSGLAASYSGSDNIFHQSQVAGQTWANYAESEGTNCQSTQTTFYKNGHVPGTFYTDLKTPVNTCAQYQTPMGANFDAAVAGDSLPTYTWISPNECDGTYWVSSCSTPSTQRRTVGDTWLSNLIPRLTAMPSYAAGQTLIIITWDEGDGTQPHSIDCTGSTVYSIIKNYCTIPTIVVSPYIVPGAQDSADHNLYGLLGTTQDILGLARLNRAVGQASMRPGLGF